MIYTKSIPKEKNLRVFFLRFLSGMNNNLPAELVVLGKPLEGANRFDLQN